MRNKVALFKEMLLDINEIEDSLTPDKVKFETYSDGSKLIYITAHKNVWCVRWIKSNFVGFFKFEGDIKKLVKIDEKQHQSLFDVLKGKARSWYNNIDLSGITVTHSFQDYCVGLDLYAWRPPFVLIPIDIKNETLIGFTFLEIYELINMQEKIRDE